MTGASRGEDTSRGTGVHTYYVSGSQDRQLGSVIVSTIIARCVYLIEKNE